MHELREDLLNLLADVEAGLDFTEEDIHFVATDALLMRLGKGLAHLTLMRRQIEQRALGQCPFRAVLAGKPNAGKSSLFNALVGRDAALASAEPGTTRDYLEKLIEIDGVALELVDTAGLGETDQAIEACAQTLGKQQSREADLTLWCIASDEPAPNYAGSHAPAWEPAVPTPERGNEAQNVWPIATKADLAPAPAGMLATSARTGWGVAELRRRLAQEAAAKVSALAPSLSRCRHHVETSLQHLRQAHAIAIHDEMPELLALELRLALEELGAMAGAVYTDDLLDRIFSRFCIGK
jgi:tRNA modification GTPase